MKKLVAVLALTGSFLSALPADAGGCSALRQRVVFRQSACPVVERVQVQKIQKVQQVVEKVRVQEVQKVVVPAKQIVQVQEVKQFVEVQPVLALEYIQVPVYSFSAGYSRESVKAEDDLAEIKRDISELKEALKSLRLPIKAPEPPK